MKFLAATKVVGNLKIIMIQIGTKLRVSDNSGAKKAICLRVCEYKRNIAYSGDLILISVRSLRNCRKGLIRVKKGEMYKALVIRTKTSKQNLKQTTRTTYFNENSVVLLNKHKKLIGTRVIGPVLKSLRHSKYLRIASVCFGLI